jgi:hypothetical protein
VAWLVAGVRGCCVLAARPQSHSCLVAPFHFNNVLGACAKCLFYQPHAGRGEAW